ncbi:MAG: hypothetical protein ACLS9F_16860 [Clostridium paraputrificum]
MIDIKNLVKYTTPENPLGDYGVVAEILRIESSVCEGYNGRKVYRIEPLDARFNNKLIEERNIVEAYSMHYQKSVEDEVEK